MIDKQDKLQEAVAGLEAHDDYFVLRRIPPATKWQLRNQQEWRPRCLEGGQCYFVQVFTGEGFY